MKTTLALDITPEARGKLLAKAKELKVNVTSGDVVQVTVVVGRTEHVLYRGIGIVERSMPVSR